MVSHLVKFDPDGVMSRGSAGVVQESLTTIRRGMNPTELVSFVRNNATNQDQWTGQSLAPGPGRSLVIGRRYQYGFFLGMLFREPQIDHYRTKRPATLVFEELATTVGGSGPFPAHSIPGWDLWPLLEGQQPIVICEVKAHELVPDLYVWLGGLVMTALTHVARADAEEMAPYWQRLCRHRPIGLVDTSEDSFGVTNDNDRLTVAFARTLGYQYVANRTDRWEQRDYDDNRCTFRAEPSEIQRV